MDKEIKRIYDLMYSPIVTPYNLLENAKLDNYKYVKYYKGEDGLVAEMQCIVDEIETIFFYCFDDKDYLQKVYKKQENITELVFEREEEVKNEKNKFYKDFNKKDKAI